MNTDLSAVLRTSVPLFLGFPPEDIQAVLPICQIRPFQAGEVLMQSDAPSTEMYLILSGEVLVRGPGDVPLARISRLETVGEMGIFTGEPRSATVLATRAGHLAAISRADLIQTLAKDPAMAVRMYKNVVEILSARLRNENLHLQMYRGQVQDLENRLKSAPQPAEETSEVPSTESSTIFEFYRAIGIHDLSAHSLRRDQATYKDMRERGYSDEQIREAALWTAKNIRGAKAFIMVKYAVDQAVGKPRGEGGGKP